MNFNNIFIYLSLILTLTVTIAYSLAESSNQIQLHRVKRRGGRGGGRSRSSGRSSGKSKTKISPASAGSYPKQPGSHVNSGSYPKQPAYNPNYNQAGHVQTGHGYGQPGSNIGTGAYPKQPAYNPNYNQGGVHYPQQQGHNYGQPGYGYGHGGYGQPGFNTGTRTGGFGGVGTGLAAGALGAAVGAYGGYKLGRMVGNSGANGNYGYYDTSYHYVKCPPPPKILVDPQTNISYIPKNVKYDVRCSYFDQQPPKIHPSIGQLNNSMGYYTGYSNSTGNYTGLWPINSTNIRTTLSSEALGAAVGAFGSYKLGRMVGQSGLNGYYGYYDHQYQYIKCPPPPKIEFDTPANMSYIPDYINYDKRCSYYEREPPKIHPYYSQHNSSMGFYTGFTNSSGQTKTVQNTNSNPPYILVRTKHHGHDHWRRSSSPPMIMTSMLAIVSALVFDSNILFTIFEFF